MQVRRPKSGGVQIDMTPMIDVVFQLLAFFLMTFQVAAQEGDFNVKMPLGSSGTGLPDQNLPLKVRLTAAADGTLTGISVADRTFSNFDELHRYVVSYVADDNGPSSPRQAAECELDCDEQLRYENVIAAITAVSGSIDASGNTIKLIDKINFSPIKK